MEDGEMITITHIRILNGNNEPALFSRIVRKVLPDEAAVKAYRKRIKEIAMRRYKKSASDINVNFHTDDRTKKSVSHKDGR
jgi:hypothetical protein